MKLSPNDFGNGLEQHVLTLLWRHWAALGAATHVPAEDRYPLDLEALLCATRVLSEHDGRLDKLASEWLSANGGLVSASRLGRIRRDFEKTAGHVKVALVQPGMSMRLDGWLGRHGSPVGQPDSGAGRSGSRPSLEDAKASRSTEKSAWVSAPPVWPAAAQLTLRRLFGVNARAEVLLYLLSGAAGSSAGIARSVGYDQKSVYRVLESWVEAGMCSRPGTAARRGYGLTRTGEWQRLLGFDTPVAFVDWPSALLPLLLLLRAASAAPRQDDSYLLSSLMRDLDAPLASTCRLFRLPFPDSRTRPGAAFFEPAAKAVLDLAGAMAGEEG
ncbi:MAG: hypothetical protein FJ109_08850 [Deltaproteobacteria bacterium]|nr:hypothetical protein [Deltaproteobacteria bacterium]